jgi:glucose-6-phosphate isomerase
VPYRQQIDDCFAESIGAGGLPRADFEALAGPAAAALSALGEDIAAGRLPAFGVVSDDDDLVPLEELAARLRGDFQRLVVLGTGGSSLGGRALAALAEGSRLCFLDNLDAETLDAVLADSAGTAFLAISKSGGTVETLCQLLVCLRAVRTSAGEAELKRRFVLISEPGDNPLRQLASHYGLSILDHDPGIGGRYAVLSLVGLLPALVAGLDARAVRAGARSVLAEAVTAARGTDPAASAPAAGAALAVGLARRGQTSSVLMPYAGRLADFAEWYCQLWAESLGKGGRGTTPIKALGPLDQHSQLQLYLDGPDDKMFTLIGARSRGRGAAIDPSALGGRLDYLSGRTVGDVVAASFDGTAATLAGHGRPVRRLHLEFLDEQAMGALFMHFMLETVVAARLLDVDPFDQPAVEDGKIRTRQMLGAQRPDAQSTEDAPG